MPLSQDFFTSKMECWNCGWSCVFQTQLEAAHPFCFANVGNNCKTQGTGAWCHWNPWPGAADWTCAIFTAQVLLDMSSSIWILLLRKWAAVTNIFFLNSNFCTISQRGQRLCIDSYTRALFRVDANDNDANENNRHQMSRLMYAAALCMWNLTLGIPREPVDFLNKASGAGHPMGHCHPPARFSEKRFGWVQACKGAGEVFVEAEQQSKETDLRWETASRKHVWTLASFASWKKTAASERSTYRPEIPRYKTFWWDNTGLHFAWLDVKSNVFPRETKRPEYTLDIVRNMAKGVNNIIYSQVVGTKRWRKLTTTGFGVTLSVMLVT